MMERSRVALLLHRHISVSGQDGRDLSLHEGPRHRGPGQGTALSAGAVHLPALTLAADEPSGAGEAELVVRDGGTLDKVGVFQALSAQGAAEQRALSVARGIPGASGAGAAAALPRCAQALPRSRLGGRGGGGGGAAAGGAPG